MIRSLSIAIAVVSIIGTVPLVARDASAQLPFRDFDTVLGFYDPDNLIEQGAILSPNVLQELVGAGVAMRAAVANEIANLALSAGGTQYFFGADRMFYVSGHLGSLFIEPPWTTGEGNGSLAVNTTYLNFQKLDGNSLDRIFDFKNNSGVTTWDGSYDLDVWLTTLSFAYGITEKMDVGVVLPFVQMEGKGKGEFTQIVGFPRVTDFEQTTTGLADMILRLKYELYEVEDLDNLFTWSIGFDVKLPNGNDDELLGTGDTGYRFRTLVGKQFGRFYPSCELAYSFAGVDVPESLRTQDVQGNTVRINTGLQDSDFDAIQIRAALPVKLLEDQWSMAVEWMHSNSNFAVTNDLGVSTRIKLTENFYVQGGLRFPLDEDGLRSDVVPTFGGELRF